MIVTKRDFSDIVFHKKIDQKALQGEDGMQGWEYMTLYGPFPRAINNGETTSQHIIPPTSYIFHSELATKSYTFCIFSVFKVVSL